MKKFLKPLFFIAIAVFMSNCATLVSKSIYPVRIEANPEGSKVTITNRAGMQVFEGAAPASVMLNASAGFFKPEMYNIKIEKAGYATRVINVTATLDDWYIGNICFGGLIGWLIVDPASGAMYQIEPGLFNVTLQEETANLKNEKGLQIMDINEIPEEWKAHLIKINQN